MIYSSQRQGRSAGEDSAMGFPILVFWKPVYSLRCSGMVNYGSGHERLRRANGPGHLICSGTGVGYAPLTLDDLSNNALLQYLDGQLFVFPPGHKLRLVIVSI